MTGHDPLLSSWSSYQDPSYAAGEALDGYLGRLQRPGERAVPVVYFADYQQTPSSTQRATDQLLINAHAGNGRPVVVPELGGDLWATPAVVDPGGHVDDAISYAQASADLGTDAAHVAVVALGAGTLNALNWAWRHAKQVRAMVLIAPIVDAEKFYNDNPSFQASINAAWGSGAAWTAALPDIDPMANLDQVRPFAHRIQLWYGDADTVIDAADVQAYAELTGAVAHEFEGTHSQLHQVPADQAAMWTIAQVVDRQRVYIGWDERDVARFTQVGLSLPDDPDNNTTEVSTVVAADGRRVQVKRTAGTEGNERLGFLLGEMSVADVSVRNIWHNGVSGEMVGQHGNIMRAHIDGDQFTLYMCWSNVLFIVPWIIHRAVWTGTLNGPDITQLGAQSSTIPGLRLAAGGLVHASERTGGVVTLVVDKDDLDRSFVGLINVAGLSGLPGYDGLASRVSDNQIQYPQAGADVISGGPGSWAEFTHCFPFEAHTELSGTTMRGRFYKPDQDPPEWGDPDWTFTWEDTGGWGHDGYGLPGWLAAHVGFLSSGNPHAIQVGAQHYDEL